MKAKDLDNKFDEGENISSYLDIAKARRPQQDQKRSAEAINHHGLGRRVVTEGGSI